MKSNALFTPSWCRARRLNDVVPKGNAITTKTSSLANDPHCTSILWWRNYPCLVCGKEAPAASSGACGSTSIEEEEINNSVQDSSASLLVASSTRSTTTSSNHHHKRCSRCHSAIYCCTECQRRDYTHGKHKANCTALGKLWKEKADLENCLWDATNRRGSSSTNPFDDDDEDHVENDTEIESSLDNYSHEYPTVGKFWHDHPQSTMQKTTTLYCVTLLQLVQLLGRGEAWRVSRIQQRSQRGGSSSSRSSSPTECNKRKRRRGPGNPLSRELAIDIAFTLLQLDLTDMRVRLLIPSLLLEGEYYQEAYDYLKTWLHADASLMIMDLALMGGGGDCGAVEEEGTARDTTNLTKYSNCDMFESPEVWMDGEMVYPSVGMVFELAFLKCHLLCSLRSGQRDAIGNEHTSVDERCSAMGGEVALEHQVKLLLSLVHKWNPHLLPKLAEAYDVETGASATLTVVVDEGMPPVQATPPALSTLLNKHPPGFELQYKMGNPGGKSIEEAVAIWQRDMILWHVVDPMAMQYLSNFCSNLEDTLVSTHCLNGGVKVTSCPVLDDSVSDDVALLQSNVENAQMRKEAEDLAKELQQQYPDRTMDEIMAHPEMAMLMIKHLRNTTM